jgi:cell migration-inducing and hyaluronan-binding protein
VRAGTEIMVTTERKEMNLTLREMDAGSSVILEIPGFTTAASGTQQNSLDALRVATNTSYFKDADTLWVKLVSEGDPGTGAPNAGAVSVQVSR